MSLSIHGLGAAARGPTPSEDRAGGAPLRATTDPTARREARGPEGSAEAAGGVDPRLWELLSADERAFYLRSAASGPLTYGPATKVRASSTQGRQVGGRIDLRV